ncbi:putative tetratricopeptide-like helical domain superfamily, protein TONSOKU [Dioscorea sansibarensis]
MARRRDEEELNVAKRGFKEAAREGNHEEEARWANVLGDIYKQRGEYVEALKWLRIDYEVSVKHLPCKQLLPTCQSLGDVYLRLDQFKDALIYQKKHLELAKDSDDLVEQQRASTQLGRTYHEMFLLSENDHHAIRNAKKYFKSAMKLVDKLRENESCKRSTVFLKEFIDAHNNIGLLELDLENLEEAENFLLQGLKICDDEEIPENDDARSRLHHNLGKLYLELRDWGKARVHIEKDIVICKRIGHPLGESKGFINLGELHYRIQKYDEAIRCYQKALDIAKLMEDEDALVSQINQNIKIVKEAAQVLEELERDEHELKKLMRSTCRARGTSNERKCLLKQKACLDRLIDKSSTISVWPKHREFAKRIKKVATELCDKEKLSDSYLAIGESYQKLRNFSKARKWYMKSWNIYKSIGNLEGQALAKINIGEVLDSSGDWVGALEAFEDGYRLAVDGKLLPVQLSALENMHYSHMIRFDNLEEARKLQRDIQKLRQLLKDTDALRNRGSDYCSETDTEGGEYSVDSSDSCGSPDRHKASASKIHLPTHVEEIDADAPLVSLFHGRKKDSFNAKTSQKTNNFCMPEPSIRHTSKSDDNQLASGRKRLRIIVSDDESDEPIESNRSKGRAYESPIANIVASDIGWFSRQLTSYLLKYSKLEETTATNAVQDLANNSAASKDVLSSSMPVQIEESVCSFKSKKSNSTADNDAVLPNSNRSAASGLKSDSGCASGDLLANQKYAGFNLPEHENDVSIVCDIFFVPNCIWC